jgi:predicted ABC-class ATPase
VPPPRRPFRAYHVVPDDPIVIEVEARNGQRFVLRGIVKGVPWIAGDRAQRIVIHDAVADPADPADPVEES